MKRYFIIFIFILQLFADVNLSDKFNFLDKKIDVQNLKNAELMLLINNLTSVQYQRQFLELNNVVMNIDTEVKKQKVGIDLIIKHQLKRYESYLKAQQDKFDTTLKATQERYEVELKQQTYIFGVISTSFIFIFTGLSFFGYGRIKKHINKKVKEDIKSNHINITKEMVSDLIKSDDFINTLKAEVSLKVESKFDDMKDKLKKDEKEVEEDFSFTKKDT